MGNQAQSKRLMDPVTYKFQDQLQQATFFSHISSLNPKAQDTLDTLMKEIKGLLANDAEKTVKNTANITYRENKKKDMLKEDQVLYQLLVKSIKGRAKDIAFQSKAFALNNKPTLPGAQAYQNLVKKYGDKPHNVVDKYT